MKENDIQISLSASDLQGICCQTAVAKMFSF